jgi:hypothetical protein
VVEVVKVDQVPKILVCRVHACPRLRIRTVHCVLPDELCQGNPPQVIFSGVVVGRRVGSKALGLSLQHRRRARVRVRGGESA